MTQTSLIIQQKDLDTYRKHYAPKSTPEEWELFIETCQAYGLSPMRKQIYLVSRPVWNAQLQREEWKATPQVSIEGLRDMAARRGKYQGRVGPFWKGKKGEWTDCWNIDDGDHPYAAKVGVWKEGFREPLFAVVYFHEMAQYTGQGDKRKLNKTWDKMGIIMLAKCAEAASIRASFPETSGLYIHEEMQQANAENAYIVTTPEPDEETKEQITGKVVDSAAPTYLKKIVIATEQQLSTIRNLCQRLGEEAPKHEMTSEQAKSTIQRLAKALQQQKNQATSSQDAQISQPQPPAETQPEQQDEQDAPLSQEALNEIKAEWVATYRIAPGDIYKRWPRYLQYLGIKEPLKQHHLAVIREDLDKQQEPAQEEMEQKAS